MRERSMNAGLDDDMIWFWSAQRLRVGLLMADLPNFEYQS